MPLTTTDLNAHCDVCGSTEDYVGVAAVPGAAVSIGWCRECLKHECQPMFVIEATLCMGGPTPEEPDAQLLTLGESVAKAKEIGVGPTLHLADWFLDAQTYTDGEYIQIRELLGRLYEAAPGP